MSPALSYEFQFSSTTTEPPTGSQIRSNASDQLSTLLWVRNMTTPGEDVHEILMRVAVGDDLYIQDYDDHTKNVHYVVTGPPVDKDSYVEFPVAWVASGGALLTQKVSLLLISSSVVPAEYLTEGEGDARYVLQGTAPAPPTTPVDPLTIPWRPTVDDVAALIRARTKDASGNELGTFTADTRPTDAEVEQLITNGCAKVATLVGWTIPADAEVEAKHLAALWTACEVEQSYWPEQVRSERSAFAQLLAMFEYDVGPFIEYVSQLTPAGSGSMAARSGTFVTPSFTAAWAYTYGYGMAGAPLSDLVNVGSGGNK